MKRSNVLKINSPIAVFAAAFALFFVTTTSFAQFSEVDPTFVPVPSKPFSESSLPGQLIQPDGKIVIWNRASMVIGGMAKGSVARLNDDGTADGTFNYCGCLLTSLNNVLLQPDGKILLAGTDGSQGKVVRLNTDGSSDPSFLYQLPASQQTYSSVGLLAIQPDEKVFIETFETFSGFATRVLRRLNPDGTVDGSFTALTYSNGRSIQTSIRDFALEPNGTYVVAFTTSSGSFGSTAVRRYLANGTVDSSFEQPTFARAGGPSPPDVSGIDVQPDGTIVAGGNFDTVNGVARSFFVRLLPAGNVDLTFSTSGFTSGGFVKAMPDGRILVNGVGLSAGNRIYRLSASGAVDPSFVTANDVASVLNRWRVDSLGRVVFFGLSSDSTRRFFRLNSSGDRDVSFDPNVSEFGKIQYLLRQSEGKAVYTGTFDQVNGVPKKSIARSNSDGTPDPTFDPDAGFNTPPNKLSLQADGKILAVGDFTSFDGTTKTGIARLNSNGTLDTSFAPAVSQVNDIDVQADGKILIAGQFSSVNGVPRTGVARLSSDGSLDTSFNPVIGNPFLTAVRYQADGKIMIGGSFSGVNGFNRSGLARLNSDGTLDQSFTAANPPTVGVLELAPDGKYLVGYVNVSRRNSDGSVDTTFLPPLFDAASSSDIRIWAIKVEPDGSMFVGGEFTKVGQFSRSRIVRLSANGGLDTVFLPKGADAAVRTIALQPDNKILIGGDFSRVQDATRAGIARIAFAPFRTTTKFDFDGDGRADIGVLRPSTSDWYILPGSGGVSIQNFGLSGDISTPADFDGDGKTDLGIYRPSAGTFWYRSSVNGGYYASPIGSAGDIPRPSDFDGDGRADFVVYRPSEGNWYRYGSSAGPSVVNWGVSTDMPLVADFDGDGKSDVAVYRPSTGVWWFIASTGGARSAIQWGQAGDLPAPADYDGDGRTDPAVFRPSSGVWYIYNSGSGTATIVQFGVSEDRPVAADYDGDGRADIAVFRPSTGVWYLLQTTAGFAGAQFGASTDVALPNSFLR